MNQLFKSFACLLLFCNLSKSEPMSKPIEELSFLIGSWNVIEENHEKNWWEKSIRVGQFILNNTYIELTTHATSSSGKSRVYKWYIHHNLEKNQFEMVSIFSNWYKIQFDILEWDKANRTITIKSVKDPNSVKYHERFGILKFDEQFNMYSWNGENKYGDKDQPNIWHYQEHGKRIKTQ